MAVCKSCGAAIVWVKGERNGGSDGRAIPLDPDPRTDGNIQITVNGEAHYLSRKERATILETNDPPDLFVSHFATCPDARLHRRSG